MNAAGLVLLPDGLRVTAVLTSTPIAPGVTAVEALVRREDGAAPFLDRHLRARSRGARPWPRVADVLTGPGGRGCSREGALRELGRLRQQHPGALVTVVHCADRRCVVRLGCGTVLLLAPAAPPRALLPSATVASLLHACLAAGVAPEALTRAVVETVRSGSPGDGRSAAGALRLGLLACPQTHPDGRCAQDGSPTRSMPARSASGG